MGITYAFEGKQPNDDDFVAQMNSTDIAILYTMQVASLAINLKNLVWTPGSDELQVNNLVMTSSFAGGTFSISGPLTVSSLTDGRLVYLTVPAGLWSTNTVLSGGHFNVLGYALTKLNPERVLFGKRKGSAFHLAIPDSSLLT
jgi:hypothetical protein